MAIKERVGFISKNREIIYNVFLIILIPATIIINAILFIEQFKETIDQSLYLKATAIAEVVNSVIVNNLDDTEALQRIITDATRFNGDVRAMDLLMMDSVSGSFKTVASLDETRLEQLAKSTNYIIAWNKNWPVATLSTETSGPGGKLERVWLVAVPVKDQLGQPQAMLSLSVSLDPVDQFTKPVLMRSLIILTVTVAIVILLLFGNARLFEYALLYNKIKEVDRMKDEFISMASHELRTPITVIDGYATIMLEDQSGQMQMNDLVRTNLIMMKDSAVRLKALIEDLLNVSRIEQGRLTVTLTTMDINDLISQLVKELSNSATEKKLSLSYQPHAKKLPLIAVDADRLKQVLINIIGNAIKYTPSGSVNVTTNTDAKNEHLEIKVKDTGLGMNAKERERLFEKFYRVQNDRTAEISGTGLGLWITKQLVELMKGEIGVDSIENVGTQITLKFPIIKNK